MSRTTAADAFAGERNRMTLVDAAGSAALARTLAAFPDAQVRPAAAYIDDRAAAIDPLLAVCMLLLACA